MALDLASIVIAVDGPSGAGKSSVSKLIADRLGLIYIDTGAMYRAVTFKATEMGIDISDHKKIGELASLCEITFEKKGEINHTFLDGNDVTEKIRESDISLLTSKVSSFPEVRKALVELQRKMGASGGVIMDGRDVGTVIFPKADIKFYLDASLEVRGKRRHRELQEKSLESVDEDETLREMALRDDNDISRTESPLTKALDAIYIDTSDMNQMGVVLELEKRILARINKEKRNI